MTDTTVFEQMLELGKDNALLRFTLGSAFHRQGRYAEAVEHLQQAVSYSPEYTAAWKLLGRSLADAGRSEEAAKAFEQGLLAARGNGDKQAEKEITVFLKRARAQAGDSSHDS
ncbi:tetratricopeptide repeat protein [Granulosicoccaceae sp. 1_MG-2023]|nr:tetratricopeptide repeat protein [Granulosicoccaceae sp. 1_MG-2023]